MEGRLFARSARFVPVLVLVVALALPAWGCTARQASVETSPGMDGGGVAVAPQPGVAEDKAWGDNQSSQLGYAGDESRDSVVAPEIAPPDDVALNVADKDRLVVRNKTLRLEVKAVEESVKKLRELAKKHKGVVTGLQIATRSDEPIYRPMEDGSSSAALSGYVTVRVPVKEFEAFSQAAADLGKLQSETENTDDVTQQHVDLKARLKNAQAEEARLREFFEAAKKVSDMLAVEKELERVREEVESLTAQIEYLERQAAMSTITIELVEPEKIVRPSGYDWGFDETITGAIRAFVGTLQAFIVLLGYALALAIPVALVLLPLRWWFRRRRGARETAAETPADE